MVNEQQIYKLYTNNNAVTRSAQTKTGPTPRNILMYPFSTHLQPHCIIGLLKQRGVKSFDTVL